MYLCLMDLIWRHLLLCHMRIICGSQSGTSLQTTVNRGGTVFYGAGAAAEGVTINNGGAFQLSEELGLGMSYSMGDLTANYGNIRVAENDETMHSDPGRTLNIASLTGDTARLILNTDIARNMGDKVNIDVANAAKARIVIAYDTVFETMHYGDVIDCVIPVLTVNSGGIDVNGYKSEWGAIGIVPTISSDGSGTWKLTRFYVGASENTMTAADSRQIVNEAWLQTVNSLNKRLGDLRFVNCTDDGVWVRFQKANDKAGGERTAAFNANYYQFGYDKKYTRKAGKSYTGLAVDHLDGTSEYERGSGQIKGTSFALYNTYIADSGHYYDLIARYGHFNNDYSMTSLLDVPNKGAHAKLYGEVSKYFGDRSNTLNYNVGFRVAF